MICTAEPVEADSSVTVFSGPFATQTWVPVTVRRDSTGVDEFAGNDPDDSASRGG